MPPADNLPPVLNAGSGVTSLARSLVLNATYEPLAIVSSRRALLLVLDTKAEVVHATARFFHSARAAFPEPSVVRLSRFVRVPYDGVVTVNRRTVFARDGHRCQYCGAAAENIDHVVPRSRGGKHAWDNVVAACRRCNMRKEDHLPHEVGFVLHRVPTAPKHRLWLLAMSEGANEDWAPYLDGGSLTATA
jgi:5-methylcytosine-specific restriction endonuclease McrA